MTRTVCSANKNVRRRMEKVGKRLSGLLAQIGIILFNDFDQRLKFIFVVQSTCSYGKGNKQSENGLNCEWPGSENPSRPLNQCISS
jgi:hypothetical protein